MAQSLLGVLAVLALVLGLLVLAMRFLRRFAPNGAGSGKVTLEVVQRVSLSPKQGIAIVRIGERLVAVSMGDGGVHALVDVNGAPVTATAPAFDLKPASAAPRTAPIFSTQSAATTVVASALPADFRNLLRTALRGSTTLAVAGALLLPVGARDAQAQGAAPSAAQVQQVISQVTGSRPGAAAVPGGSSAASAKGAADQLSALTKGALQQARARQTTKGIEAGSSAANNADQMISRAAPTIDLRVAGGDGLRLSGTVGVVIMMGLLTMLPSLVLMMTGFTRILVVLHFLRQAIGTQSAPPAQLIAGLALLITGFVMAPTLSEVNRTALQPWMDGKIEQQQMLSEGVKPFRTFMLRQVRPTDLTTFANISGMRAVAGPQDVPLVVLVSAFVTSEMRTAFQIGFALFLPFIVIDVVVASVLMSMGMMMLPPAMISLPFKLLLFVLVDGWTLIVTGLVQSFH
jgi:flagellar biosynthetic protein FliP